MKFTPTSFATLSSVFASVTKSSGVLHAAPPISAIGVTEIRLFTIGIPYSLEISSPGLYQIFGQSCDFIVNLLIDFLQVAVDTI